ncbi:DUF4177 domain-containing protein [Pseudoxanthomonas sp. J35]|uniref:DUF4177 domain-containing protein n=1 Tax=Pseudoxanthomonas sp. J35 TaxID=935852 RepID=UPI00048A815E|nr:DUF4177 domain-containing protein [Pseudoxanthomonas sp. J35]
MSTRWQYHVVEIKPTVLSGFKLQEVQEALSRQGQLGWELVNIITHAPMMPLMAVFKRPD